MQILTSTTKLKSNDKSFKGEKADFYKDGNTYKYTCGASSDYNAIVKRCKELKKKFSGAFIIAFRNGERIDTKEAIKEYNKNKE